MRGVRARITEEREGSRHERGFKRESTVRIPLPSHSPRILETLNRLNPFPFFSCQLTIPKKRILGRRSRENFLSGSFVTRSLLYIHEGFARVSEARREAEEEKEEASTRRSDKRHRSIFARESVSVREGNLFSNRIRYGLARGGSFQYPSKEWDDCNDVRTSWF